MDLFCGAGGLTHGLISAGIDVVAGVDFDDACEYPYTANHTGAAFHKRDVATLEAHTVADWFGDAEIRVLAGCAPCQPFSSYAHRYTKRTRGNQSKSDSRWGLLSHFARLVKELKPDIVTMENVPTVTRHTVFADFVRTLESEGYHVWHSVIDCADYGLPQRRRRTVLLASLHGRVELAGSGGSSSVTVKDAIKKLPVLRHGQSNEKDPLHTASKLSPLNLQRIRVSKPGGTWRDWPARLVAKCHKKTSGKSYPGVYGRMSWDEPAPTLTTQFFGFGNGRFGHPSQSRALSLREGALLQGFPQDYAFVPEGAAVQLKVLGRLIGNAVPVDLGRAIGNSIIEHVRTAVPFQKNA